MGQSQTDESNRSLSLAATRRPEVVASTLVHCLLDITAQKGSCLPAAVGSGFSEKALETLYGGLQKIKGRSCPFINLPEKR